MVASTKDDDGGAKKEGKQEKRQLKTTLQISKISGMKLLALVKFCCEKADKEAMIFSCNQGILATQQLFD